MLMLYLSAIEETADKISFEKLYVKHSADILRIICALSSKFYPKRLLVRIFTLPLVRLGFLRILLTISLNSFLDGFE